MKGDRQHKERVTSPTLIARAECSKRTDLLGLTQERKAVCAMAHITDFFIPSLCSAMYVRAQIVVLFHPGGVVGYKM